MQLTAEQKKRFDVYIKQIDKGGLALPKFLKCSDEERKKDWAQNPPKRVVHTIERREESEDVKRFRELEALRQQHARKRVSKSAEVVQKREERKQERKRASRDGLVDMKVIADALKITAKEARAALRAAKFAKPACGWAFKSDQVENIKQTIVKQRAADKKKREAKAKEKKTKQKPG